MALAGAMKCIKYLLCFFNLIFCVCGVGLIVLGATLQLVLYDTFKIQDAVASAGPIILIGVGAVAVIITFFGSCGAWKENYCMLGMFVVLVIVVIIVEAAAAIVACVYQTQVSTIVFEALSHPISLYSDPDSEEIKAAVDALQIRLKCCGVHDHKDWVNFRSDNLSVPDSCCVTVSENCGHGAVAKPDSIHQQGCQPAVVDLLMENIQWVIVAAFVTASLHTLGVGMACVLMRAVNANKGGRAGGAGVHPRHADQ